MHAILDGARFNLAGDVDHSLVFDDIKNGDSDGTVFFAVQKGNIVKIVEQAGPLVPVANGRIELGADILSILAVDRDELN